MNSTFLNNSAHQAFKSSKKLSQEGFTLIELVLVIVLLGVLSAIAIPKFVNMTNEAEQASVKQFIGALNTAATIAFSKLFLCDHYLVVQPNKFHLATFVRVDGNPALEYGVCPEPFSNGAAHAMDVISLRSDLMNEPGASIMVDNLWDGDHMNFVTKSGHTIDIIFDPSTRTVSWTADPAY
jgi:MSHA pilin protein MshA